MIEKSFLFGKTLTELKEIVTTLGFPGYTAAQIADWLYKKDIHSIEEMSNLSKKVRDTLSEHFGFGLTDHSKVQVSVDGTKKYLFPTQNNKFVEAAYIPEETRSTLCVSSQVAAKWAACFA